MSTRGNTFRTDINGLRAYAVLAVILYHFNVGGMGSGFIGVDVFFVISGFLMAHIILDGIDDGSFTLKGFYYSRLRRILPALVAVCTTLLVVGAFLFGPTEYASLGKHITGSLGFVSNFVFRSEEGYFDTLSQDKWLLHTWSLSVEAQFYLLFPLLLVWLRRRRNNVLPVLWSIATISFLLSAFITPSDPEFSFYLLPTRAWELLAGSIAFIYANRTGRPRFAIPIEVAGIGIIIFSAFIFQGNVEWPGYWAAVPVLGTVMVLFADIKKSHLTGTDFVQALGKWSYSLYLWHWPIAVGLHYLDLGRDRTAIAIALVLTVLLGAFSFYVIERPTRRMANRLGPKAFLCRLLIPTAIVMALSIAVMLGRGFESRMPAIVVAADREAKNFEEQRVGCGFSAHKEKVIPCDITDGKAPIKYFFWGDSHVGNIAGALRDTVDKGILYNSYACPTLFNAELYLKNLKNRCTFWNDSVMQQVEASPPGTRIIIANLFGSYLYGRNDGSHNPFGIAFNDYPDLGKSLDAEVTFAEQLRKTYCRIAAVRPLYVFKPSPELPYSVPRRVVRQLVLNPNAPALYLDQRDYEARNRVINAAIENAATSCPNITVVDPIPYLCPEGKCAISEQGRPQYIDDNHLSAYGSRLVMPLFAKLFPEDVRPDWRERMEKRTEPAPRRTRLFTRVDPGIK